MKINRRSFLATTSAGAMASAIASVASAADQPDWTNPIVGDPHRPVYHFLPPRNWMNDPNGLIQFKGEYHLFYQFAPAGPDWGSSPMHWGHAKSADLVRWQHLPIALFPDQPYDHAGVWSGCMVDDRGTATAMYTGLRDRAMRQCQCVATTTDMATFTKFEGNPVIAEPPPNVAPQNFRDPYLFRHGNEWLTAVGASFGPLAGGDGAILLYRSDDLRRFEYLGPLYTGSKKLHGPVFECPSFFPLADRWALIVSPMRGRTNYFTGAFDGRSFVPDHYEELDLGGCLYAPQVFADDSGRRIMFGWLKEDRGRAGRGGWQGVQSLPREITMGEDGRLRFRPAAEVESLRVLPGVQVGEKTFSGLMELTDGVAHPSVPGWVGLQVSGSGFPGTGRDPETREPTHFLADSEMGGPRDTAAPAGAACEILAEIDPGRAARCGLVVRSSRQTGERTLIVYDAEKKRLTVDRRHSSLDPWADRSVMGAPFSPAPGGSMPSGGSSAPLRLRVFVDHSVIEVFAGDRLCLSSRVYPTARDADGIGLFAEGGEARLVSAEVFKMQPVMEGAKG